MRLIKRLLVFSLLAFSAWSLLRIAGLEDMSAEGVVDFINRKISKDAECHHQAAKTSAIFFEEAERFRNSGQSAYAFLEGSAAKGSVAAMYLLGDLLLENREEIERGLTKKSDVGKDVTAPRTLNHCKYGYYPAVYQLFAGQKGFTIKDDKPALDFLMQASDRYFYPATTRVALKLFLNGEIAAAHKLFMQAVVGDDFAAYYLHEIYRNGIGTAIDDQKADRYQQIYERSGI